MEMILIYCIGEEMVIEILFRSVSASSFSLISRDFTRLFELNGVILR